mgnify:CR=1 FL=1
MALDARSRASIFEALSPVIGEDNANKLMSEFPSIEADELVTKQFLRAELAELAGRVWSGNVRELRNAIRAYAALGDLLETAERYAPYNRDEDAPPMPVNLANDIANTESSVARPSRIDTASAR